MSYRKSFLVSKTVQNKNNIILDVEKLKIVLNNASRLSLALCMLKTT
jgi:hypothetical protein